MGFPLVGFFFKFLKDLCPTSNHSARGTLLLCACTWNPEEDRILCRGRRVSEAQRRSSAGFSTVCDSSATCEVGKGPIKCKSLLGRRVLNYSFSASSEGKSLRTHLIYREGMVVFLFCVSHVGLGLINPRVGVFLVSSNSARLGSGLGYRWGDSFP